MQIVTDFETFITDYGALPRPHYALPIALWAMATHCYEKFDAFGYLTFTSSGPGTGKTRCLEILECICHTPRLQAKITLPGMCSAIEKYKPTLLIDQAERMPKNEHSDLMACILSGYRTGLYVTVQLGGEAVDRPIYCPKAFALLGDMIAAARDRSIVIPMRAMRTRKRWRRSEARGIGEVIKQQCAALMRERTDDIDDLSPTSQVWIFWMAAKMRFGRRVL